MRDVVVFGAGVSKTLGIPLAAELLPEVLSNAPPAESALVIEFLSYMYPRFRNDGTWWPLAEDALGMMDVAQQYTSIRGGGPGYRWKGDTVRQVELRLRRLLGHYLWAEQVVIESAHCLRTFVRTHNSSTVYVTFNYDLTLETALSLEGIPYCYGIPMPTGGVSILKPHGSINWFLRTADFPRQGSGPWMDMGPNMVCWPPLDPQHKFARAPFLIPPSPNKQVGNKELKRIWTSLSSALHTARNTFVCGYSLPEADRLARLALLRAARAGGGTRGKSVHVVNPDVTREEWFRQNVSESLTFEALRFEQWVATLPRT